MCGWDDEGGGKRITFMSAIHEKFCEKVTANPAEQRSEQSSTLL